MSSRRPASQPKVKNLKSRNLKAGQAAGVKGGAALLLPAVQKGGGSALLLPAVQRVREAAARMK